MTHPHATAGGWEEMRLAVRCGDLERALALLGEDPEQRRLAPVLAWLGDAWPESLEQGGPAGLLEELARQLDPRRLH